MEIDWSKWIEQGPMVAALMVAVLYFYRREKRSEASIDRAMKKCEERESRLEQKISSHESELKKHVAQQGEEKATLLRACMRIMETNGETFRQLTQATKDETDKFHAVKAERA
jgi:hypothetical protein